MKKITLLPAVFLSIAAIAVLSGCGGQSASQSTQPAQPQTAQPATPADSQNAQNAVTIKNFSFNPAALSVKKGAAVTWTNEDSTPHQIVSDSGAFQGSPISNGQNYSFTFDKTGEFFYHCGIHPSMKAKIIVE